jgi:hypothetical protein
MEMEMERLWLECRGSWDDEDGLFTPMNKAPCSRVKVIALPVTVPHILSTKGHTR